ncbi:MAG TPA: hypothetical protein VFE78_13330 [Gemmataceae bacterium]|jgi:hypothetical protein|nr:hypothetical protein [Gemmataceae bacterium]
MRSALAASLLTLAVLAGLTATARADVFVQVPFVTVRVGRPLPVYQPPAAPLPGEPPPVPVPDVPLPPPRPVVTGPAVTVARPPTVREFAASFRPLPGTYKVVLQHPVTCAPVEVCFTLPPGCPRKVRVRPRELDFVYPGHTVAVRFVHNGSVRVRN